MKTAKRVHVLTVATENYRGLQNLKASLQFQKYNYFHVLGLGQKWGGWAWRTQQYLAKIKELHSQDKYENNNVYILVDATDVFFTQTPEAFLTQFHRLVQTQDNKVVFSAETSCNLGSKELIEFYTRLRNKEAPTSSFIFPNHGSIAGYGPELIEILTRNANAPDDQDGIQDKFLKGEINFTIDYHNTITGTLPSISKQKPHFETCLWEWDPNRKLFFNKQSGNCPIIFHFPGRFPFNYNAYLKKLYDFLPFQPRPLQDLKPRCRRDWLILLGLLFLLLISAIVFKLVSLAYKNVRKGSKEPRIKDDREWTRSVT